VTGPRRAFVAAALALVVLVPATAAAPRQISGLHDARHTRAKHSVHVTGRMRQVTPVTPGTIEDHGTVTGMPFGSGSVLLVSTIANGRFTSTFRLTLPRGSVSGTASLPFTITGSEIDLKGTARLTSGTGAYRRISSGALQAHVHDTLDGQSGRLSLKGSATY
jgi:hypothetical protein